MPTVAEALQIGWRRHQAGEVAAAEQIYHQVLQAAPNDENAWCFLGMACHDQGRYEEAVEAYQHAIRIKPDFPVALSNFANTLRQQGKFEEAITSCREAIRIRPDYGTAYNNLGAALVARGRLDEALVVFEKALTLMPNDALAHANLGAILVHQGRFDEGTTNSQKALRINPNFAEAHKNQAIVWLLSGDFERGWPEYEWRWKCPGSSLPEFAAPRWDGSPLAGRTILLYAEQGLGDTIHFVRYARLLKAQGARVIVACQKALLRLLGLCEDIDVLLPQDAQWPPYDFHAPLLSLPGILDTTTETMPADVPYLCADPELVDRWRERLAPYQGLRIGIAWQGSPNFRADRQRSIPLTCFAALADIPGVHLFSLQKGNGVDQIHSLAGSFDIIDFGDELDGKAGPFMDTAAIIKNVDLIISSDTSIPHLAGALGVPVWTALSLSPDWRWLLDREDTPWYPTMRLFRQQQLGDWEEVFERIVAEARQLTTGREGPRGEPHEFLGTTGFNSLKSTRHGWTLFNRNDVYIGRSLDEYGEYSEGEIELLHQFVRAGDTVVEAGANIGAHTLPLAKMVGPTGRIYSFEPQRIVFQNLCANIALNSLAHVDCRQAAVGAEAGEIVVPFLDYASENNFGGLGLGQYTQGERVPMTSLDSLGLDHCRLLKIDVEGMEKKVLEGAAETIARCQPLLYFENDRQEKSSELIQYVLDLGYRLFWHLPPLFRSDNFFQQSTNVFGKIVSVNVLGVPAGSEDAVEGLRPVTSPESRWQGDA